SYIARREDFAATAQYLIAVAISAGATSGTPFTSAGLSGSVGSAASRSHSTRSADCAWTNAGAASAATTKMVWRGLNMDIRLRRGAGKFKARARSRAAPARPRVPTDSVADARRPPRTAWRPCGLPRTLPGSANPAELARRPRRHRPASTR
ncbi:hypothetical protein NS44R_14570, partial [Mammaliicoccus sciuri]